MTDASGLLEAENPDTNEYYLLKHEDDERVYHKARKGNLGKSSGNVIPPELVLISGNKAPTTSITSKQQ